VQTAQWNKAARLWMQILVELANVRTCPLITCNAHDCSFHSCIRARVPWLRALG
jgi:hypothetical protein